MLPKPLTPPPHVPQGLRRRVDVSRLVERIVISPEADDARVEAVKKLVTAAGLDVPVGRSQLCAYPSIMTDLDDILKYSE